jgi:hypothetical protein
MSSRTRSLVLILALLVASGGDALAANQSGGSAVTQRPDLAVKPGAVRRDRANVFISGHSLTDQPMPTFLALIAASLGTPMRWNRQYVVGSTLRERTRGVKLDDPGWGWGGYRLGANREGEGMDVLAELREPRTIGGERYDTLLITEQNGLLWSLLNYDSVRYLRHFHERFIEGNPQGQTYFYEPWASLNSKDDPRRWIAFERAASPVWQCIATRVNISLAAEGRRDRIASMPGGWMMAALVERATQGAGVPGVSGATIRETLDRLFSDDVHLTPLGSYYLALVTYATLHGRPPLGAWAPDGVSPAQAKSLQQFAWDALADYRANNQPLDLASCRRVLTDGFIGQFWSYSRDTTPEQKQSKLRGYWRSTRNIVSDHWQVRRNNASNPLHYDAATDKDYWFPAP